MIRLSLLLVLAVVPCARAAASDHLIDPAHRLAPDDPAWSDITGAFARQPDTTADFTERRFFPFKKAPIALAGEVRISRAHGLSLHYTAPDERIVAMDGAGLVVRQPDGTSETLSDARANAANAALVHALRFELPVLARDFELYGRREGAAWTLAVVPRAKELRRAIEELVVSGEAAAVHRIEIRRSAKQYIEIRVGPPRTTPFTAGELQRFFR